MGRRTRTRQAAEDRSDPDGSGLESEDTQFTEAMAWLDASGAWPVVSEKVLREKDRPEPEPPRRRRPTRRSAVPTVGARLDLHGDSIADALHRLERFLVQAAARDRRRVLVITGRGRRSAGGVSVLRSKVSQWLRRSASPWVREVEPAPDVLGGDGAFLVHLRRPRPR